MVKRYDPKAPLRSRYRGVLLFILPFPLLAAAIVALASGQVFLLLVNLLGFAAMLGAAWLTRIGISLDEESKRRHLQRHRGKMHYRLFAALLLAITTALVSWFATHNGLFVSIAYGGVTLLAYYLYYGLDETRSNPDLSSIGVSVEEVIEAIEQAEDKLEDIEIARRALTDLELKTRLKNIIAETRKILERIEQDPKDLRRARKFLKVYLEGLRKVTRGYASLHRDNPSEELEKNFRQVLTTIENIIREQHSKLLENNEMELDVQIEVLELQLKKEGIH